ncbi:antibiotic biosynthesis monooxygenase [Nodosilinea sp. FACHB-131]|uniref:putative quinol monooxygenase n=1 Tax=Cyanophyceae TaxID=3028117 RepID=UPI001684E0A7|nr:putative quinol monooxygenase [Nodosilinea sp. FACHB-131]MBD1872953.1 antibiotic biosynthesis monooxygenase [Nodosilinea sp. FACHB-131]
MILVSGKVRFHQDDLERIRPAIAVMINASLAEDGCIDYAYSIDVLDPTVMRIIERWRDRAALAAHFQTPHMAQWNAVLAELDISDRELFMMDGDQLEFAV